MYNIEYIHTVFLNKYIPWRSKCINVCTRIFEVPLFIRAKKLKQIKSALTVEQVNNFWHTCILIHWNGILHEKVSEPKTYIMTQ